MSVDMTSVAAPIPAHVEAAGSGATSSDSTGLDRGQHPGNQRLRLQPSAADRPRPSGNRGAGPSSESASPNRQPALHSLAVAPVADDNTTGPEEIGLPKAVLALLICPRCLAPVLPRLDPTIGQAYDCQAGCRPAPIAARTLEMQIRRALAGTVPIDSVTQVLRHIVVEVVQPGGIRLAWHRHRLDRPQPPATPRPLEGFLPPRRGRRS